MSEHEVQQPVMHEVCDIEQLRHENDTLRDKYQREIKQHQDLMREVRLLRQKERVAVQQYELMLYQTEQLREQYQLLANSRLGRLTLRYWNWKDRSGKHGIGAVIGFIVRLILKRPSVMSFKPHVVKPLPSSSAVSNKKALPQTETAALQEVQTVQPEQVLEMSPEQETWVEQYMAQIAEIPDSNGCRYYNKLNHRIGLICDEFFYESISAAADFVFVTPENWQEVLDGGLDAFLFVTAWRGLHGEWRGLGTVTGMENVPERKLAINILETCRQKGIPTVFYSKEDPPNYEVFLEYAKHCDHICTTASECIPYYRQDCGKEVVNAVSFGINPVNHNPIGFRSTGKDDTVLFSGSWMLKYPDRCKELATIFDGILATEHGLHIIDRNYPGNKKYLFPDKYFPYTSPALPHGILQKLHKLFDWAVNINSVKGSETMFANRAFELQANGVLMLSNFSVGVNNMLPTVMMVQESSEVGRIMDSMTAEERYERQIAGVRSVMTHHTCFDRVSQILQATGLETCQPVRKVLVLADKITDAVKENFSRQSYPYKTLVAASDTTAEQLADYDLVAWFSPEAEYGGFYLEDMVNGFKYTACDYVTKDAWYENDVLHEGVEHNFVNRMGSKYRTVFWRKAFNGEFLLNLSDEQMLENGYSIDHFQYNAICKTCEESEQEYLVSVVVPVFNNGLHLYGKSFASLTRSTMFRDMEIILVDDGSTDDYTLKIESELERKYCNVRLFRFCDGGSGSVSRSRNKGVTMASAPYVVFLNPESEAIGDGYAKLYEAAQCEHTDIAVGGQYACSVKNQIIRFTLPDRTEADEASSSANFSFASADIQTVMIRRELLEQNRINFVEGAEHADALYFWQIMYHAQSSCAVDFAVTLVYTQLCAVGHETVSLGYFEKQISLETEKLNWLKEKSLLETYMERRYEKDALQLLNKLSYVGECDAEKGAALVWKMLRIYTGGSESENPLLRSFEQFCVAGDYKAAAECVNAAFPKKEHRPMMTLEEMVSAPKASMYVEYQQEGTVLTFYNRTETTNATYAWTVLLDGVEYRKVSSTKYGKSIAYACDFSKYESNTYKLRAFIKSDQGKKSEDIAVIRVDSDGTVVLFDERSTAINKGR